MYSKDYLGNAELYITITDDSMSISKDSIGIIIAVPTAIKEFTDGVPDQFKLYTNYPNPFNPSTMIVYDLPKTEHVILSIYNILGQKIKELENNIIQPGKHLIKFDAGNLTSGLYFYQIEAGEYKEIKKLVFLK